MVQGVAVAIDVATEDWLKFTSDPHMASNSNHAYCKLHSACAYLGLLIVKKTAKGFYNVFHREAIATI